MAVQQEPFYEALRLLHSKASDSCEQLKVLLDEALHHTTPSSVIHGHSTSFIKDKEISLPKISIPNYKKGSPKHIQSSGENFLTSTTPKISSPLPSSTNTKSSVKTDVTSKSDSLSEKRTHDKVSKSGGDSHSESKKLNLESSSLSSHKSLGSSKLKIDLDQESSSQEENTSATDLALEMGLACVICRSIQVTSGNTLVECQDCHGLYHQECHKPPITDQDVNDPRLVWYCAKCTKTMKKMVSKNSKSVKPVASLMSKDSSVMKPVKSEPSVMPSTTSSHIFKRIEPKMTTSTANSSSSGNKPIGLAGLAASLSGRSVSGESQRPHPSQKTSQSSNSNKPSAVGFNTKPSSNDSSKTAAAASSTKPFPSLFNNASNKTSSGYGVSSSSNNNVGKESSPNPSNKSSGGSGGTSLSSTSTKANSASSSSTLGALGGNNNGSASSSSSSLASTTGKTSNSSSLMSADKRLQIMKKKAAAKMQEKRRISNK